MNPIKVVLFEPNHPNNIGAAARAMKTMGETELCLVNPAFFPSPAANALASSGVDLLENATVKNTLSEAIHDCQLILATSGRDDAMGFPVLELREACLLARQYQQAGNKVVFIFGAERTGLTNNELKLCHYHVRIPTSDAFSSLNLAQAVQVVCYELFMARQAAKEESSFPQLAAFHQTARFYTRFEELLRQVDFLKPGHDKIILQKLRRLFQRTQLEENEVIILLGIISNIERNLK